MATAFEKLPDDTAIGHGGATGADAMSDIIAEELGFPIVEYRVSRKEWEEVGDRAGLNRNSRMLEKFDPHLCLAFRSKQNSRGTNDMIKKCKQAGVPTKIYDDWK